MHSIRNSSTHGRWSGRSRRAGSVSVLVAVATTALFGFCALAVDYGLSVATKNRLQRACDAAALAGAQALPNTALAQYQAQQTAGQNTVTSPTITWPNGVKQIGVSATQQISFFFGGALGIPTGTVTASAVASRIPVSGLPRAVPIAITTNDYNTYKNGNGFAEVLIDNNRQNFVDGTMVALDLRPANSGKSGNEFEEDVRNGYNGTVTLNNPTHNALNAALVSQGGKLRDAIDDRFDRAAGAPWYDSGDDYTFPNYPSGNPRVMIIIVADPNPADNNNPTINGRWFAPVYVDEITGSGNSETKLRFRILPNFTYGSEDSGVVIGDENTIDTGIGVVKLVQ